MPTKGDPIDPYVVLRISQQGDGCWEAVCSWDCARRWAKTARVGIGRFESASGWDFDQPYACLACGRVIPAAERPDFLTADMFDDAYGYHEVAPRRVGTSAFWKHRP